MDLEIIRRTLNNHLEELKNDNIYVEKILSQIQYYTDNFIDKYRTKKTNIIYCSISTTVNEYGRQSYSNFNEIILYIRIKTNNIEYYNHELEFVFSYNTGNIIAIYIINEEGKKEYFGTLDLIDRIRESAG